MLLGQVEVGFRHLFRQHQAIMLTAAITRKRIWFYTPAIVLSAVVVFRFLGWMLHGAPLVLERMALEAIFATIMIVAAFVAGED